jgi:hypothetical protein
MSRELDTKYDLWSSKRQEFISSQCNIFSNSANASQKQTGDEKLVKLSVSSFRSYFGVVSLLVITVIVSARYRVVVREMSPLVAGPSPIARRLC